MMPGRQISGTNALVMRDDIVAAVSRSEGFLSGPVFLDTGSENVVALEAQYHLPCYRPALFDRLEVVMPTLLAEAVPKRQAEFLAGRFLGQAALRDQKISNALRTFDTWFEEFADHGQAISVEPNGANLAADTFFRGSKDSAFALAKQLDTLDPSTNDGLFMIACLLRGGLLAEGEGKEA